MTVPIATGVLPDQFRYVRVGRDGPPLVVLPGLALDDDAPGRLAIRAYGVGFGRLAAGRQVYVVSRPPGAAAASGLAGVADAYADLIAREWGRADVLAFSTGGMVAQHLALDHPDRLDRLVLVVSGARLSSTGRAVCGRWLAQARDGQWRELRRGLAAIAVDGPVAQAVARAVTTGRRASTPPAPGDAADFAALVGGVLAYDTRSRLAAVRAPTLVVGGAVDPLFPAPLLRETAAAVPAATLRLHPASGHGLPKHRARWLQEQVADFLGDPAPRIAGPTPTTTPPRRRTP